MNNFILRYRHFDSSENFIEIYEGENLKNYQEVNRTKDKVYYLKAPEIYRYAENDLLELYRWIIINKQFIRAKNNIKQKTINFLKSLD